MATTDAELIAKLYTRLMDVLEELRKHTTDRTASYRLQAEIEDLEMGPRTYWEGAHTDDPPATWGRTIEEVEAETCDECGLDVPGPHPHPAPDMSQAEVDLKWLMEHGGLKMAAGILAAMRKDIEFGEKA